MQKNYRDFTVGELLDMGIAVDLWKFNGKSKEECKQFVQQFEGAKQSTHINALSGDKSVRLWKEKFSLYYFWKE